MKLLAISDLHGDEQALEKIAEREKRRDYDYLLIAGDLGGNISYAEDLASSLKQAFYVPGNADNEFVVSIMEKAGFSIHGKVASIGEYSIAGFGYSPPTPFRTPGELSEEEIYKGASSLPIDNKTIFLTHAPPRGVLDYIGFHAGSSALRRVVEEKQPFLHVFGHIHEVVGKEKLGNTTCINLPPALSGKAGLIEIEEGNITFSIVPL